jgi:hypothetical protein
LPLGQTDGQHSATEQRQPPGEGRGRHADAVSGVSGAVRLPSRNDA